MSNFGHSVNSGTKYHLSGATGEGAACAFSSYEHLVTVLDICLLYDNSKPGLMQLAVIAVIVCTDVLTVFCICLL